MIMRPGDMAVSTVDGHVWGEDLMQSVDQLLIDETVTIIEEEDLYGWTHVVSSRGKKGYVHKRYLKLAV
jgi:hypothetical protein